MPVPRFLWSMLAEHVKGRRPDALVFPHPDDPARYLPVRRHPMVGSPVP
ncbi:hypothetical protein ACIHDR_37315 [Nocardia sp. NPDC052278]